MGKRGPKSRADREMAALPTVLPQRLDPPASMDDEGKARWREIVNELPVSRLRKSDLKILADLIQSEKYVAQCDAIIAEHGQVIGPGAQINPAVTIRDRHVRTAIALQRALRLCPSMRKRQDDADLQVKATSSVKKPWEF